MDSQVGNNPSYVWRSIQWGKELLKQGSYWRIGTRDSVKVYEDRWIPRPTLFKPFSPKQLPEGTTLNKLRDEDGNWNEELIRNCFLEEDAISILSIPLSRYYRRDSLAWFYDKNGKYSVKSGYHVAVNCMNEDPASTSKDQDNFWKTLWNLQLPGKIKIFLWRACTHSLPMARALMIRTILSDSICPRCRNATETVEHALVSCPKAWKVWKSAIFKAKLQRTNSANFKQYFSNIQDTLSKEELHLWVTVAWSIWYAKNSVVHGSEPLDPAATLSWAQKYLEEYKQASMSKSDINFDHFIPVCQRSLTWQRPTYDRFKMNVDTMTSAERGAIELGIIVRDDAGAVLMAASLFRRRKSTAMEAETVAILEGLLLAREQGFFSLEIELDALNVVKSIHDKNPNFSGLGLLISDILDLKFLHVPRSCHGPAHKLAKHGLTSCLDSF